MKDAQRIVKSKLQDHASLLPSNISSIAFDTLISFCIDNSNTITSSSRKTQEAPWDRPSLGYFVIKHMQKHISNTSIPFPETDI